MNRFIGIPEKDLREAITEIRNMYRHPVADQLQYEERGPGNFKCRFCLDFTTMPQSHECPKEGKQVSDKPGELEQSEVTDETQWREVPKGEKRPCVVLEVIEVGADPRSGRPRVVLMGDSKMVQPLGHYLYREIVIPIESGAVESMVAEAWAETRRAEAKAIEPGAVEQDGGHKIVFCKIHRTPLNLPMGRCDECGKWPDIADTYLAVGTIDQVRAYKYGTETPTINQVRAAEGLDPLPHRDWKQSGEEGKAIMDKGRQSTAEPKDQESQPIPVLRFVARSLADIAADGRNDASLSIRLTKQFDALALTVRAAVQAIETGRDMGEFLPKSSDEPRFYWQEEVKAQDVQKAIPYPEGYVCSSCGVSGVRLWRPDATVAMSDGPYVVAGMDHLYCQECDDRTGIPVPAIPYDLYFKGPPNGWYWAYSKVPADRMAWWEGLPVVGGVAKAQDIQGGVPKDVPPVEVLRHVAHELANVAADVRTVSGPQLDVLADMILDAAQAIERPGPLKGEQVTSEEIREGILASAEKVREKPLATLHSMAEAMGEAAQDLRVFGVMDAGILADVVLGWKERVSLAAQAIEVGITGQAMDEQEAEEMASVMEPRPGPVDLTDKGLKEEARALCAGGYTCPMCRTPEARAGGNVCGNANDILAALTRVRDGRITAMHGRLIWDHEAELAEKLQRAVKKRNDDRPPDEPLATPPEVMAMRAWGFERKLDLLTARPSTYEFSDPKLNDSGYDVYLGTFVNAETGELITYDMATEAAGGGGRRQVAAWNLNKYACMCKFTGEDHREHIDWLHVIKLCCPTHGLRRVMPRDPMAEKLVSGSPLDKLYKLAEGFRQDAGALDDSFDREIIENRADKLKETAQAIARGFINEVEPS